jgi:hypothetical protein
MEKFYVRSTELRSYNVKHGCIVLEVVDRDKLLVELDPPIPSHVYGQIEDLNLIVLTARYEGTKLTPVVSEWPCKVNICLPKEGGNWKNGPWRLLDIGELTK